MPARSAVTDEDVEAFIERYHLKQIVKRPGAREALPDIIRRWRTKSSYEEIEALIERYNLRERCRQPEVQKAVREIVAHGRRKEPIQRSISEEIEMLVDRQDLAEHQERRRAEAAAPEPDDDDDDGELIFHDPVVREQIAGVLREGYELAQQRGLIRKT